MKDIPIGIQDFKEVREKDYYFVDKSDLISQILDAPATKVRLFTRPRRFGKSMNLSMIDAFLNINYEGNTWFNGLSISKREDLDNHRNAYPVINLDLHSNSSASFESFIEYMKFEMYSLFSKYTYVLDSGKLREEDSSIFSSILNMSSNAEVLAKSLKFLSDVLFKVHGKKTVILIDEYDNPIHNAYGKASFDDTLGFLRTMLSSALKGNDSLAFGIVSGVLQISKESIFSGLNNLKVNNIFSKEYDEMFGFTAEDVLRMCTDYGHPEKFNEAKEWYDGYHFGDAEIYNPWSVLNYISEGFKPATYWAGTSGNAIIDDLLRSPDISRNADMENLASGKTISKALSPFTIYSDLENNPDAIYSVMAMSGYINAVAEDESGYLYSISIPNKELYEVFASMVTTPLGNTPSYQLRNFTSAVLRNDIPQMEKSLYASLGNVSSRILTDEKTYQAFITGMLMYLAGTYEVEADKEEGKGYFDIRLKRKKGTGPNVIIELKFLKDATAARLENAAQRALKQIRSKDYLFGLEGETAIYGTSFCGKEMAIKSMVVNQNMTQ